MALFKPFRGGRQFLDAVPKVDGHGYFCVDDGSFWIDFANGEVDAEGNAIIIRKQIASAVEDLLMNYTTELIIDGGDAGSHEPVAVVGTTALA
jgi:hypothetical protein